MDDTNKIVAAILAASLCAKAGSTDLEDYIVNYEEIAHRLDARKPEPVKKS